MQELTASAVREASRKAAQEAEARSKVTCAIMIGGAVTIRAESEPELKRLKVALAEAGNPERVSVRLDRPDHPQGKPEPKPKQTTPRRTNARRRLTVSLYRMPESIPNP